ncbi:MAG TPA: tetratricopeptide repeat protein [Thermoanaerobaculia bacterium]|nr:tetratricopeptide repeat protein [Thermoanaerobaculia bacterium]
MEPALTGFGALISAGVLPYIFALLAVSLLPIKRRVGYFGVSLALAMLWGWLASAAVAASSPGWAVFAAIESLVLLGLAMWGKLDFGARSGPWAATGTAILAYALLVFPFLGRFLDLEPFQGSAFASPLPAVLFTCGILLFALEPIATAALAIPLLWALGGGPQGHEKAADLVELTGLRVALLAGAAYLLQAPELRRGGGRLSPGAGYRFANRYRMPFSYGLWTLALATALLFFYSRAQGVWLPRLVLNLALLLALGIVLWMAFTAWQSFWYRAAAWWIARAVGRIWVWLGEALRWGIPLLAAAAVWAILSFPKDGAGLQSGKGKDTHDAATGAAATTAPASVAAAGAAVAPPASSGPAAAKPAAPTLVAPKPATAKPVAAKPAAPKLAAPKLATATPATAKPAATTPAKPRSGAEPGFWRTAQPRRRVVQLFAAAVLLWLAYLAYRGRKRLVIGPFVGCTGNEQLDKDVVAGVVPALQNELARISDIFKVIDEATPSHKSAVIQVTPGVQDIGTILKDASAISLGPLKIPANLLVGLVGQMVSGPRLTGALHKIEDDILLTAEISGGGLSGNWQIDARSLDRKGPPSKATVHELVVQLAFRIATDLVPAGSPRWRAIRAFTEGLRAYRETQRREREKVSLLRQSERCFIQALDEDQQFTQCHFNLGVVYRQLGENKSAQAAFRRALREDPDNFEACYALAEALATDEQHPRALWFCEAAIAINPDDARVWDLKAYAERYSEQERQRQELGLPPGDPKMRSLKLTLRHGDPAWRKIRATSEIAVALAWRTLCRRALRGPSAVLKRDRLTALTCTRNLAVVLARSSRFPSSLQLFRQAAWLAPRDPSPQVYEGRTFFWSHPQSAPQALRGVFADGLAAADQAMLWSVLAQADARFAPSAYRRTLVRLAHTRFLDVIAGADAESLADIADLSLEEPPVGVAEEEPWR